jgi:hypothetical protein
MEIQIDVFHSILGLKDYGPLSRNRWGGCLVRAIDTGYDIRTNVMA